MQRTPDTTTFTSDDVTQHLDPRETTAWLEESMDGRTGSHTGHTVMEKHPEGKATVYQLLDETTHKPVLTVKDDGTLQRHVMETAREVVARKSPQAMIEQLTAQFELAALRMLWNWQVGRSMAV